MLIKLIFIFALASPITSSPLQVRNHGEEQGKTDSQEPRVPREGRQYTGYDYTVYDPAVLSRSYLIAAKQFAQNPAYFGQTIHSMSPNGGAGGSAYGSTQYGPIGDGYLGSYYGTRYASGYPSGSYSNTNAAAFSSNTSIHSYGTAATTLNTRFGPVPGTFIGSGQLFHPPYGSAVSGISFVGSQYAGSGGFMGINSRVTGTGYNSITHTSSMSNAAGDALQRAGQPFQANIIANTQSATTKDGSTTGSATSHAIGKSQGTVGGTASNVQAVGIATSEGNGYAGSITKAAAQAFSDGKVGTVTGNVRTESFSKGKGVAQSVGNANALAHGSAIGGQTKSDSSVSTNTEGNEAGDGQGVIRVSSIKSQAGGLPPAVKPAGYSHTYNYGPVEEENPSKVEPKVEMNNSKVQVEEFSKSDVTPDAVGSGQVQGQVANEGAVIPDVVHEEIPEDVKKSILPTESSLPSEPVAVLPPVTGEIVDAFVQEKGQGPSQVLSPLAVEVHDGTSGQSMDSVPKEPWPSMEESGKELPEAGSKVEPEDAQEGENQEIVISDPEAPLVQLLPGHIQINPEIVAPIIEKEPVESTEEGNSGGIKLADSSESMESQEKVPLRPVESIGSQQLNFGTEEKLPGVAIDKDDSDDFVSSDDSSEEKKSSEMTSLSSEPAKSSSEKAPGETSIHAPHDDNIKSLIDERINLQLQQDDDMEDTDNVIPEDQDVAKILLDYLEARFAHERV